MDPGDITGNFFIPIILVQKPKWLNPKLIPTLPSSSLSLSPAADDNMGAKAKKALKKNMKKISASAAAASSELAVPQNPKPSADFLVFSSMLSLTTIVSNSSQIPFWV